MMKKLPNISHIENINLCNSMPCSMFQIYFIDMYDAKVNIISNMTEISLTTRKASGDPKLVIVNGN